MPKQPFVPVGQVVKVKIAGTNQTHPWNNFFHFKYSGAMPDGPSLDAFAQQVGGAWMSHISGVVSQVISQTAVQVWDLTQDTGSEGNDSTVHNGQVATLEYLPASAACVVSWPVKQRWRGGHFRTYTPFANAANITNGSAIDPAVVDAIRSAWLAFLQDMNTRTINGLPVTMGGVRYFPVLVVPKTSGNFLAYESPVVKHRLDSQRRRLGKETV